MPPRYLTKLRFKTALECPTKLYFAGKREYANACHDDAFIQARAADGFQVGELAKLMHPGAIKVVAKEHGEALRQTNVLPEHEEVTIFEAAVCCGVPFVRGDILKKRGNRFELIEATAKSYLADGRFTNARNAIKPSILTYLQDVVFQVHGQRSAFPDTRNGVLPRPLQNHRALLLPSFDQGQLLDQEGPAGRDAKLSRPAGEVRRAGVRQRGRAVELEFRELDLVAGRRGEKCAAISLSAAAARVQGTGVRR